MIKLICDRKPTKLPMNILYNMNFMIKRIKNFSSLKIKIWPLGGCAPGTPAAPAA